MTDRLLPYYQKELSYIRRLMSEFAGDQPDAAARLRIRSGGVDDPHVARLIEAFAYLTARIRLKLDDEFPEISDAFLAVLYPHYLAPIPSAAIIQMVPNESVGGLTVGYDVPLGTAVELSDERGVACRFRTAYDTTLWPLEVSECKLQRRPFVAPDVPRAQDALGVVRVRLKCMSSQMTFGQFDANRFQSLRFFLAGQDHHVLPLYELLLNHCLCIAVAASPEDTEPLVLDPEHLQPVGFAATQNLLPYDARSFPGFGLLTDYFAFPQKFLFVDLHGVGRYPAAATAGQLDVYFYLDRDMPSLEAYVTRDTMRLGCTPIVNLFSKRAEPIRLTHRVTEYPIIPDARRRGEIEIYSIDRVITSSGTGETVEFAPLFSCPRGTFQDQGLTFWQSHRRSSTGPAGKTVKGTDLFLSLMDLDFRPAEPPEGTLIVETTCFNRDLPGEISRPRVRLVEGAPLREVVPCLIGPTPTRRPQSLERRTWALVSHLLAGHLSISDVVDQAGRADGRGAEALRRILDLYNFHQEAPLQKRIDGISRVTSKASVARMPDARSTFARGVEITVEFDEDQFQDAGQGLYLFASVLESFFGMYCSINSFSRMTASIKQGERLLKRWPPRVGQKTLL